MNTQSPPTTLSEEMLKEALEAGLACAKNCPLNTTYHERVINEALGGLSSLLHAAEQMAKHQWQPIESAPRDGASIIGLFGKFPYEEAHSIGWWGQEKTWASPCYPSQPTHWMPLPPAPEKQERGAAKPKKDAGWATCTSCGTYDWLVSHEPHPGICAKCAAKEGETTV